MLLIRKFDKRNATRNNLNLKNNLTIKIFMPIKPTFLKANKMAQWCLQSTATVRILTWSPTQPSRNWDHQKRALIFNW